MKDNQPKCFAHNHLTPAQYGVWSYARGVSNKSKIFQSGCRMIAAHFSASSKSAINREVNELAKAGWFQEITPKERTRGGIWKPASYRVLSHDDWASGHPDECEKALQRIAAAKELEASPVPSTGQVDAHLSQNEGVPVPSTGHTCPKTEGCLSQVRDGILIKQYEEFKNEEEGEAPPAQPRPSSLHTDQVEGSGDALKVSARAGHMDGATCPKYGTGFVDKGLWPTRLPGKLVVAFQNRYVTAQQLQQALQDPSSDFVECESEMRAIDPDGTKQVARVRLTRNKDGTWFTTYVQPFSEVKLEWFEKLAKKRGN